MRLPGPQIPPPPAPPTTTTPLLGRARPRQLWVHRPGLGVPGFRPEAGPLASVPLGPYLLALCVTPGLESLEPHSGHSLTAKDGPRAPCPGGSNTKGAGACAQPWPPQGPQAPPGPWGCTTLSTLGPLPWGGAQETGHHCPFRREPRSGVSHSTLPLCTPQPSSRSEPPHP